MKTRMALAWTLSDIVERALGTCRPLPTPLQMCKLSSWKYTRRVPSRQIDSKLPPTLSVRCTFYSINLMSWLQGTRPEVTPPEVN